MATKSLNRDVIPASDIAQLGRVEKGLAFATAAQITRDGEPVFSMSLYAQVNPLMKLLREFFARFLGR